MSNMIILWPGTSDQATITPSTQVAALPATNVQNQEPTKKWRTTVNNYGSLIYDMGGGILPNAMAVVGANWSNNSNWRLRAANTIPALTAAPVFDSGVLSPWNSGGKPFIYRMAHFTNLMQFNFGATPCRYFLAEFGEGSPVTSYLEFGRVLISNVYQPTFNMDIAGGVIYDPQDVQEQTPYGQVFTDPRPFIRRRFDIQFSFVDQDEANLSLVTFSRFLGMSGDFIVSLDPAANSTDFALWSMQGLFTSAHTYKPVPFFNNGKMMWSISLPTVEKL